MNSNLYQQCDSKRFFRQRHSFKPVIFIWSRCQNFPQRMIVSDRCWRAMRKPAARWKYQKDALEQAEPAEYAERSCISEYRPPLGFEKGTR